MKTDELIARKSTTVEDLDAAYMRGREDGVRDVRELEGYGLAGRLYGCFACGLKTAHETPRHRWPIRS